MRLIPALGLVILVLGVSVHFYPRINQNICEAHGGKWASTYNSCVTRSCYKEHTCGEWVNPSSWCDRLRLNDSIAEVYFQLGEPERIENGRYLWHSGKQSSSLIVAAFTSGKLTSLNCPP